ncbi:MAG: hypothetical protein R2882_05335 [Gemmatimonadales bacterium]
MARFLRSLSPVLLAGLAGCAATTAPAPPPEERLAVLNAGDGSLSLVPVDPGQLVRRILLPTTTAGPADISARGATAVIAAEGSDEVVVVDLRSEVIRRSVALEPGSRPVAVLMISDNVAYSANAGTNTVTRIDVSTGDTASVAVGVFPRGLVLTRGRLFVVNANVEDCETGLCGLGPGWVSVLDPQTNQLAGGRDSIPLPNQGNPRSTTLGGDGLIYVVSTGDAETDTDGRLTIIDPVTRAEVGNFGGFGLVPASVASDGFERLFVTSVADGLMEFNTRTRRVVRGAGQGIFVRENVAVAVDSRGSIYAIEGGDCALSAPGRLRIFRPDLTEARNLVLGICPTAAAFALLPGIPVTED